jgi:hypothetical protein
VCYDYSWWSPFLGFLSLNALIRIHHNKETILSC